MIAKHVWLAALLALPGCTTVPAQGVEFVRGCWVTRAPQDGPVEAMLRLLPEGADGPTYRGIVHAFSGPPVDPQGVEAAELIFSRDGRWLDVPDHDRDAEGKIHADPVRSPVRLFAAAPPEAATTHLTQDMHWAAFAQQGEPGWILAVGADEALSVYRVDDTGEPGETLFAGARDGCD